MRELSGVLRQFFKICGVCYWKGIGIHNRGFGTGFWNMRGALWRLSRLVGVGVQEKIVGIHRGDLVKSIPRWERFAEHEVSGPDFGNL